MTLVRPVLVFCLLIGARGKAAAQAAGKPAFEVASIKPNTSGSRSSGTHASEGLLRMTNESLKDCIEMAYDVRDFSLLAPDWLSTTRFDIVAKPPAAAKDREFRQMMQTLLAERFGLEVHREPKVLAAYALVVAKGGAKLQQGESGHGNSMNSNNDSNKSRLTAKGASMERLANYLARRLDRPVVDSTELKGVYDFTLEWTPEENKATSADAGPSLFTAVQEQLGLRLQSRKLSVDILVVDHVEKVPTEN